jgi:vacuolar-type H+-ATPase subunit E/Vma4
MSLEAILSKIEADANKEAAIIRGKAEREKEKEKEKQAGEIEEKRKRNLDRIKTRVQDMQKRKEYHVQRESVRRLLNARRTLIDEAIRKAVTNLSSENSEKYLEMIASLLDNCDIEGEVEVLISSADELRITEKFLEKHSTDSRKYILSDKRHNETGGIIFRAGRISQNGTFPMIAELIHEKLVMELSQIIPLEAD